MDYQQLLYVINNLLRLNSNKLKVQRASRRASCLSDALRGKTLMSFRRALSKLQQTCIMTSLFSIVILLIGCSSTRVDTEIKETQTAIGEMQTAIRDEQIAIGETQTAIGILGEAGNSSGGPPATDIVETEAPPTSSVQEESTSVDNPVSPVGRTSYDGVVRAVSFNSQANRVAIAEDNRLHIEDLSPVGLPPQQLTVSSEILDVGWSPDDVFIGVATQDGTVLVWDIGTLEPVLSLSNPRSARSLAWSTNGKLLAFGLADGIISIRNTSDWQEIVTLTFDGGVSATDLDWSNDDTMLISSGGFGHLTMWDTKTWTAVHEFEGHLPISLVSVGVLSTDNRWLASSADTGFVRIWDMSNLRNVAVLDSRPGEASGIAWSPDSRWLATSSGESILIWDTRTWKILLTLQEHSSEVVSLAWALTWYGQMLISGAADGEVINWNTDALTP